PMFSGRYLDGCIRWRGGNSLPAFPDGGDEALHFSEWRGVVGRNRIHDAADHVTVQLVERAGNFPAAFDVEGVLQLAHDRQQLTDRFLACDDVALRDGRLGPQEMT